MITYATWYVSSWIDRSPATRTEAVALGRRVRDAGAKKLATREGVVRVYAKKLREALVAASRAHPKPELEPDLKHALGGDVDWCAIADRLLERGVA